MLQNSLLSSPCTPAALSRKLAAALRPARADFQVADWMFTNYDAAFHPGGHRLTPALLSRSVVLSLTHDATHDTIGMRGNMEIRKYQSETQSYVQLTPAWTAGNCLLGYVYAAGSARDARHHPFGALPGVPGLDGVRTEFHGRFVYDVIEGHLLFTLVGLSRDAVGVVSFRSIAAQQRERCFFSVPVDDYSAHRMPARVLGAVSMTEFRLAQSQEEQTSPLWNLPVALLERAVTLSLPTDTSAMTQWHRKQPHHQTKQFHLADVPAILSALQYDIFGAYYAPGAALDVVTHPQNINAPTSRVASGVLHAILQTAEETTCACMREIVAQRYYAEGLSLLSDGMSPTRIAETSLGGSNDALLRISPERVTETRLDSNNDILLSDGDTTVTPPNDDVCHMFTNASATAVDTSSLANNDDNSGNYSKNADNPIQHQHDATLNIATDPLHQDIDMLLFNNANESIHNEAQNNLEHILPLQEIATSISIPPQTLSTFPGDKQVELQSRIQAPSMELLKTNKWTEMSALKIGCSSSSDETARNTSTAGSNAHTPHLPLSDAHRGRERAAPRLMPRPSSVDPGPTSQWKEAEMSDETRRLAKIEHRKRQNRISSARRNAKVREHYEQQKKEIEDLKMRAATLKKRERDVRMENDSLKKQIRDNV